MYPLISTSRLNGRSMLQLDMEETMNPGHLNRVSQPFNVCLISIHFYMPTKQYISSHTTLQKYLEFQSELPVLFDIQVSNFPASRTELMLFT